jgi:hypothetical protein
MFLEKGSTFLSSASETNGINIDFSLQIIDFLLTKEQILFVT